jgi:hypothetical protein
MKVYRVLSVCLVVLALLAVSSPAYAGTCYKCYLSGACYMAEGTAAKCYAYGTSCLTTGHCDSGEECTQDCWYEQGDLTLPQEPLAMEYQLAEVKIEHFKAATATVARVGKAPQASLLR